TSEGRPILATSMSYFIAEAPSIVSGAPRSPSFAAAGSPLGMPVSERAAALADQAGMVSLRTEPFAVHIGALLWRGGISGRDRIAGADAGKLDAERINTEIDAKLAAERANVLKAVREDRDSIEGLIKKQISAALSADAIEGHVASAATVKNLIEENK